MDAKGIVDLLTDLTDAVPRYSVERGWLIAPCPLSRWTHAGGVDHHPSFGVKIDSHGKSIFNCFTCKRGGDLVRLVSYMESFTGESLHGLRRAVEEDAYIGGSLPSWEELRRRQFSDSPVLLPEDFNYIYDPVDNHPYLIERGISPETARQIGLQYDDDDRGEQRIIFPVRDRKGGLYGFTGRAVRRGAVPKVRDYFGLKKKHLVLGLHTLPDWFDRILIVEGLFDYAKVLQEGFPVLAMMHANCTPEQARILSRLGAPIYVFFDNDLAGREGLKLVAKRLGRELPVMKVRYPKGFPEKGDPAMLSRKWIVKMMDKSVLT